MALGKEPVTNRQPNASIGGHVQQAVKEPTLIDPKRMWRHEGDYVVDLKSTAKGSIPSHVERQGDTIRVENGIVSGCRTGIQFWAGRDPLAHPFFFGHESVVMIRDDKGRELWPGWTEWP